jgi:AcrR family transcriptional regulator
MARDRETKRRLRAPDRRQLIEDAASRLFAERGYAATTLEQVASAAGVTRPLLYKHFSSKKELHLTLLAKHRDALLGRLAQGLGTQGSLAERILQVTDSWFAYAEENPYAWLMLFRDTTGDPEIQAFYREMQGTARSALAALIRDEPELELPDERIEPTAEFFRSAMTGLALWWAEHPDVPRALIADIAVRALSDGLQLEESGRPSALPSQSR